MALKTMPELSPLIADLSDRPNDTEGISAQQLKERFDHNPKALRDFINDEVVGKLNATSGMSGAEQIGSKTIPDVAGNTVFAQTASLKAQLDKKSESADVYTKTETYNKNEVYNKTETYSKQEIDPFLRTGDTVIKMEVFTIVHSDNNDGTFTYTDTEGAEVVGQLDTDGSQLFTLEKGHYVLAENRITATINDTLERSVVSGGLKEVNETVIGLTFPESDGSEVTVRYFERLGLMGEHAITHDIGGTDEVAGLTQVGGTAPTAKKAIWIEVV